MMPRRSTRRDARVCATDEMPTGSPSSFARQLSAAWPSSAPHRGSSPTGSLMVRPPTTGQSKWRSSSFDRRASRGQTGVQKDAGRAGRYRISGLRERRWMSVRQTIVHPVVFTPRIRSPRDRHGSHHPTAATSLVGAGRPRTVASTSTAGYAVRCWNKIDPPIATSARPPSRPA